MKWFTCLFLVIGLALVGCDSPTSGVPAGSETPPEFSVAWSEYPSWSTFGVAHEEGLLNKEAGKLGTLEKKWNVDIVLKEADYDTCLTLLGSGTVDAACVTNMDSLAPSLGRNLVAVGPTSTSKGADACVTVGIDSLEALKGKTTYGLEKSVSEYTFERNLEKNGLDPKDYPFKNMDPAAAATAMQTGQKNVESIVVWNPFVMQTLKNRDGSKRLFDSSTIPEEIIDMVVFGKDSLEKPGGDRAAACVLDAFYEVSKLIDDPEKGDKTTVALGKKFSNLPLADMKQVLKETAFYKTPDAGLELFNKEQFQNETTKTVTKFCVDHQIVDSEPTVGFNKKDAQLNFSTEYMKRVQSGK